MKKLIIFAAAFVLSGATMSCKKDYLCKCTKTYTHSNGSTETEPDGQYTYRDTKPRAIDRCNSQETQGTDLGGSYTRDCEVHY